MLGIPHPERNLVSDAFQISREAIGYVAPSQVAAEIATADPSLRTTICRTMLEFPTRRFLYRGAERALKRLLKLGPVAIWTDEYEERIQTSGIENLDRYGDLSFIHGVQKQQLIPRIFELAKLRQVDEVVVVDNEGKNLRLIQEYAASNCPDISLSLLLIGNQQREEVETIFSVISHVREAKRVGRRGVSRAKKRLIVLDFNGTLHDVSRYEQTLAKKVSGVVGRGRKGERC